MSDPRQSRGYRNRNPGNIDYVESNKWQGQTGREDPPLNGGRPRFAKFASHEFGIRALAALLTTYQDRHGLRTIGGLINRWAPGNENDTAAYARHVSLLTGRGVTEPLDLHRYEDMVPLVAAIITHELGGNPYDQGVIDRGVALFGLRPSVETLGEAARTGTGRGAIQAAAATGAVAVAVQAAPAVTALQGLDWRVGVAIVVAAAIAAVILVLKQRKKEGWATRNRSRSP